jgi:hypothetical protein
MLKWPLHKNAVICRLRIELEILRSHAPFGWFDDRLAEILPVFEFITGFRVRRLNSRRKRVEPLVLGKDRLEFPRLRREPIGVIGTAI